VDDRSYGYDDPDELRKAWDGKPLTLAQFDDLIAENDTSEPFDPSRGEGWA
jgi:hypothetical protein